MDQRDDEFAVLYREERLRDQANFYRAKAANSSRADRRARLWRNMLLLGAALAGAATPFLAGVGRTATGAIAGIFAILALAVLAFEHLMSFQRKSTSYRDAAINLDGVDPEMESLRLVETVEAILAHEVRRGI